jgi:potassium-transporting ATPase potassium-binding subunit
LEWLSSVLPPAWALGLPIAASIPLGAWMARVLNPPADRVGRGIDAPAALLCRLFGRKAPVKMGWKAYAVAMLAFNAMLFVLSFLVLLFQHHLPLNPDGKGPLTGDAATGDTAVIFNTVCSFVTNTNLQHYSGEQALSYFSQLGAVVWLQFVTPACGLAVMLAVIRGLRGDEDMGDFFYDLARSLVHVLIPLSVIVAVLLVATGVPMTFAGSAKAKTLEGAEQTIARGPVAAEVAIKQLGTNGGGFFGPNSTHPFENPNPWSNIVEVASIIVLPMACIVMFGVMLRDRAHAAVVFSVMMAMLLVGLTLAIWAENHPSPATHGLPVANGPNLEGKEVRLGAPAAATWAAITTATSNGSVNGMHDSFQPLGGLVPMALMMLNVDFSGIGAGFLNMLMYIIVAVFIAGLMVGRTPEYLGKKVEAREVKLAMIALLLHPFLICVGTGIFAAVPAWAGTAPNPGSHGFSEILYEFASAAANNGSGFEGLGDNVPSWNIATGIVLLLGRFPALILPLAIAGSLAGKKRVPQTTGTLRTNTSTFGFMLLGTVLLVGALSFMPAVVLGPVADALTGAGR